MAESDQVSEIEQIKLDSVDLTWEQMVQEYHRSGRYAAAASAMNLKCVKNLCKRSMATLEFLSSKGFNKEIPEEAGTITRRKVEAAIATLSEDFAVITEEDGEEEEYQPQEEEEEDEDEDEDEGEGEEEEEEEKEEEEEEEELEEEVEEQKKNPKNTKNKRKKCYVKGCSFFGVHLRRHLRVHVKRDDIFPEDIPLCVGWNHREQEARPYTQHLIWEINQETGSG